MRLPLAVSLLGLALAGELEVQVRPNGASHRVAPTTYVVDSLEKLREKVEQGPLQGLLEGDSWWLADAQGMAVTSWETLEAVPLDERHVSVVPADKHFQWSPRKVGERFPVTLSNWSGLELETVANSPKLFLIHNLFTEAEALFLIERAVSRTGHNALTQSGVGYENQKDGSRHTGSTRTSFSAFDQESLMAKRLISRCFEALRVPENNGMIDGLQILRYNEGQAYVPHTDWFGDDTGKWNFDTQYPNGTNRFATVFLYLYPPPNGGYTVFPKATIEEGLNDSEFVSTGRDDTERTRAMLHATRFYEQGAWERNLQNDCFSQLAVKPVRLGAALFYHQEPMTGRLLDEAQHGACPSLTGTKWGANLWIWNKARQLRPNDAPPEEQSADGQSHSAPGPQQIQALFENREDVPVTIEWSMDDGDTWAELDKLPPHHQFPVNTFSGHLWRYVGEDGKELSRWTAPKEDAGAILVASDGTHVSQIRTDL